MFMIEAKLSEVEIVDETERGEGGFGSTGTNDQFKLLLQKYEKQIILKEIGFSGQKNQNAKVLIVGMYWRPLLIYLANIGIQSIGIIDHDKIELTN